MLTLILAAHASAGTEKALDIGYGRPPTNAFCMVTPRTTAQLINQTRSNPVVMDRYRRHFAMNSEQVITFFSGLRPGRLVRDSMYSVYGVPGNGVFHFKRRLLKRGTNVFMDRNGHAVLQMVCGNPLTLGPNNPIALSEGPSPAETAAGPREGGGGGFDGLMAMTDLDTSSTAAPAAPAAIPFTSVISGGSKQGIGSILPWFVGGAILVRGNSGGGSKSPVPEPTSMAVLALGVGSMVARQNKKS